MDDYQKEQLLLRQMQIKYGDMYYTLPDTYQEKNKAYKDAFAAGDGFIVGYDTFIYRTHGLRGTIKIGTNVLIGNHCSIDYSGDLVIQDNVKISDNVMVFTHNHEPYKMTHKDPDNVIIKKVIIHDNVWIGAGAIIMAGVEIGKFSVIGAGSVVTHSVPDNMIFAGNPAKFIGMNVKKEE